MVLVIAMAGAGLLALGEAAAQDARAAVERFLARLAAVSIAELEVRQTVTLYHPDGRHVRSTGEQRLLVKLPGRQRLEQTVEGVSEVRLTVTGRVWVRRHDGTTYEAPAIDRDPSRLLIPWRRTADELLGEWRALGVSDTASHRSTHGGRAVTVIGAPSGGEPTPRVWLDDEYGVVRFVSRQRLPATAWLDVAFSEHRPLVGGFHFPHRQEAFVDGRLVALITVRSAAVNGGLPDSLFDPEALRGGR